jgi:lipoprotein-anchoring transpeptidase ErfK/SrfK
MFKREGASRESFLRRHVFLACLAAFIAASSGAVGQTPDFEALIEDALRRHAPEANPPAVAEPPRETAVAPRPGASPAPVPGGPPPGATETGPRPYTPPRRANPPDAPAANAPDAPAGDAPETTEPGQPEAPAAPATDRPPERGLDMLRVEAVNAAAYVEDAEAIRGASPLVLKAQILLDRAGASPGVLDSYYGGNVAKAIAAVETVLGLPVDGELDRQVWRAIGGDHAPDVLEPYTITESDAAYPFLPAIPSDYSEQAQLPALGFTSAEEMFGERFHMDVKLLKALNPGADFRRAGETIRVAAIEGQPVTGKISRIEADKARRQVRAYDAQNRLVVAYPATIGSADNPSPSGVHRVEAVAPNPVYYYDPRNFVQAANTKQLQLPPGPNNPVGTVWIDLSQPSYGIHGTPEPSKIDKTGSHGCVRLTNWDAEELAGLVDPGAVVEFVE